MSAHHPNSSELDGRRTDARQLARRTDAAERTVEVLKRKVHDLYNGGTSALHRQLEKARAREENNRRKRELVEVRANELKRYSESLEVEVAHRTLALKAILDNVTFGFMVVSRELTVQPGCTRSCLALFDATQVEGARLCELLGLGARARSELLLGVDQVFEDLLPTEASLAQLPRKARMKSGTTLQLDAKVLRGAAQEVTGLLFTVSDVTALEAATRESNVNRTLVGILKQKDSFRTFVLEAKYQLAGARRALLEGSESPARHAIHTVKGNSASYGLDEVVDAIHRVEESPSLTPGHVDEVADALRGFLSANAGVLELTYDELGDEGFAVTKEQISDLRVLISSIPGAQAAELRRWTAHVFRRPAWQLLGPVDDFAQKLAVRLGKSIAFELDGAETTLDVETVRPVFQVVSHLVRNAIDHGIEGPLGRGSKPPRGLVRLAIGENRAEYVVECTDDGRGIDVDVLGRRAVEIGALPAATLAAMTFEDKLGLVFVDGLSSAPVTTSISGRGIGMSAVRAAVRKAGGEISIASGGGKGTAFVIRIPKPDHARHVGAEAVTA